jgi:hypothetical protein
MSLGSWLSTDDFEAGVDDISMSAVNRNILLELEVAESL